ncbi:MAG: hypothetical protein AAB885_03595, partial [Patescibacteria group bacterium]
GSAVQVDHPTAVDNIHNNFAFYPFPLIAVGFLLFAFDIVSNKKLWWLVLPIITVGPAALILRYFFAQSPSVYYVGVLQLLAIGLPFLVMMVIAMALYRIQINKGIILFTIAIVITILSIVGLVKGLDNSSERTGIPYLCSDEKQCRDFCHNRVGRCREVCNKYSGNPVCQKLF